MRPDLLSNIFVLKRYIQETTSANDVIIADLMDMALGEIEGITHRPLKLQRHKEVRNWESRVLLYNFPIQNIQSVTGGTTALTFDTDYQIDFRKGILYPYQMGNASTALNALTLEYDGGYFEARVTTGNNKIDFEETGGVELTAEVAVGMYNAHETDGSTYIKSPATLYAEAIKAALDAAGASTYTVTYDIYSNKLTFASDLSGGGGVFNILWSSGTNAASNIGELSGFDISADDTGAASYTSDENDDCTPIRLRSIFLQMCRIAWERYNQDSLLASQVSERIPDGSSLTSKYDFDITKIIPGAEGILNSYRRLVIG